MDAVYLVKPGDYNEELRYSLRSLAKNMPYIDRVFIAGYCPSWVRGVETIELEPVEDKFDNQRQSLRAACADERVSDEFVLMNDDHFAVARLEALPCFHLGPLSLLIKRLAKRGQTDSDMWFYGLKQTAAQMREWGYPNPDAYECHIPLRFLKARLAYLLDSATRTPFLWGSAYDAAHSGTGVLGDNVKCAGLGDRELIANMECGLPFLSTEDDSFRFGRAGLFLRTIFPEPSQYEESA